MMLVPSFTASLLISSITGPLFLISSLAWQIKSAYLMTFPSSTSNFCYGYLKIKFNTLPTGSCHTGEGYKFDKNLSV